MSESSKTDGNSSQVTSGIAFIALLLGLFAVQNTIFQPTRPPMESTDRTFSEDVRSRLWQDPFEAVEEHRKKYSAQAREAPVSSSLPAEISYIDEKKHTKKLILKAPQLQQAGKNVLILSPDPQAGYAYEHDGREPRSVCYDKTIPKKNAPYDDTQVIANSIEELQCHIKLETENPKRNLQILAVMVPNGPYAEDKEWRLRSRYAVVAALTELGYTPKDPEHIDYVDFERTCKTVLRKLREKPDDTELKQKAHYCHMGSVMPYEWFSRSNQETVLLLWLDNGGFVDTDNRTPLKMLGFLKNEMLSKFETKSETKHGFNILGPFGSGALDMMYREVFNLEEKEKDKISKYYHALETVSFYVAAATVNFDDIHKERKNKDWLDRKITRTISTQDKLADLLLCELALRGITPYHIETGTALSNNCSERLSFDEFRHKKDGSPHHIVLIGERDTYYSQQLTETFLNAIKKFNELETKTTPWVHTYSYLRGLDGITSEHASSSHKEAKNKNKEPQSNSSSTETREQRERPVGQSQLDYLLNLAGQIKRLDKQYAHEGGIKAIGITGHDAYDKLLILQALRLQFPGVLFFTTDLDARFFHPSEIKWTRNLLIASPFGLQLNEILQKKTPPFRENYQTSLFLTTQLALCKGKKNQENSECNSEIFRADSKKWINKPRLFEIGNNGAVNISHEPSRFLDAVDSKSDRIKIDKAAQQFEIRNFGAAVVILLSLPLLILFFTPREHQRRALGFSAVAIVFILFIYYLYECYPGIEPVSFTNGTSMWPSVLLKIMAVILSGYFFYRIYYRLLDGHGEDVEKNYLLRDTTQNDLKNEKNKAPICDGTKCIFIDRWREDFLNTKIKDKQKQFIPFSTLWDEYRCWGEWKLTWKRVGIALLVASTLSVAILLTSFNDVTFHHIRGQNNYEFNLLWLGLAALSYVLLILYIAERVHLSSHFIKLLASPRIEINWSEAVVQTYKNKCGLPEGVVRYRILLDFINDHAYAPNKFIYYPFFCLFLIVISRNYYFDNWPTTPFVLVVYAFFAFLTLISAIRLRAAALYARDQILEKLESNSPGAPINTICDQDRVNLQSFIGAIRDFKEGIYRPLAYHPMILNLLVPFSSVGGIYLIEYLV